MKTRKQSFLLAAGMLAFALSATAVSPVGLHTVKAETTTEETATNGAIKVAVENLKVTPTNYYSDYDVYNTLSWSKPAQYTSEETLNYKVERRYKDDSVDSFETLTSYCEENSYQDTTIKAGVPYVYRVTPIVNGEEYVGESVTVEAKQLAFSKPVINSIYGSAGTSTYVSVSLNSMYGYADISLEKSTSKTKGFKKVASSTSYYYDYDVNVNKTYYYRMQYTTTITLANGSKKTYKSAYSAVKSAKCEFEAPYISSIYPMKDNKQLGIFVSQSSRFSGYQLYRSTSPKGKYKKVGDSISSVFINKNLTPYKKYYYKVKGYAYNTKTKKMMYTGFSDVSFAAPGFTYMDLKLKVKSSKSVQVSWKKVKGVTGYDISMYNGSYYTKLGSTSKTSYTFKNLAPNTYYNFRITATKKVNAKKYYFLDNSISYNTGLGEPENVEYTPQGISKGKITWTRVVAAQGYEIAKYDATKDTYKTVKILGASKTSYTVSVKDGGGYFYVRAYKKVGGKKEYSSYRSISCYPSPKAVTGLKVSKTTTVVSSYDKRKCAAVKISWKKSSGANEYRVYRTTQDIKIVSPYSDSKYNYGGTYVGSTEKTSIVDCSAEPGVRYYYYVVSAVKSGSYSVNDNYSYSKPVAYTLNYAKPVITSAKNSAKKTVKISWKAVSPIVNYASGTYQNMDVKYTVYYSTKQKGSYKKLGTTTKTSLTKSNLSKGKTYYFKVVATSTSKNSYGKNISSTSVTKKVTIKK